MRIHTADRTMGRQRVGSSAFTLIEVLVVVAIIALLVAVLLPSLVRAREQSRAAICASQLKQYGSALSMYNNESRDLMPGPLHTALELGSFDKVASADYEQWHLPAYVRKFFGEGRHGGQKSAGKMTDKMSSCPTALQLRRNDLEKTYARSDAHRAMTYVLNNWNSAINTYGTNPPWYFGYPNYFWEDSPPPFRPLKTPTAYTKDAKPKNITVITQPGREWAIADAFCYLTDLPSAAPAKKDGQWRIGTYQGRTWARSVGLPSVQYHSDGINVLCFDSHVEWQRPWKGTMNPG